MTPLLWLAATAAGDARVVDGVLPPVKMIGDIPGYALDKHTAIGKGAIHRPARENRAVREVLATGGMFHRPLGRRMGLGQAFCLDCEIATIR